IASPMANPIREPRILSLFFIISSPFCSVGKNHHPALREALVPDTQHRCQFVRSYGSSLYRRGLPCVPASGLFLLSIRICLTYRLTPFHLHYTIERNRMQELF